MNIIDYPDRDMMMINLANRLAGELKQTLLTHETASFAVPGGTTPGPVFDALCAADIDWGRVRVMLTDERWVPETSERSNTRLLRQRLLVERAAAAVYVPLYADAPAPEDALAALGDAVAATAPISVMLLGMGADMHTASLFPGADKLAEAMAADAPPLMAMRAPGAPEPRITMTLPLLKGAIARHILIVGPEKRAALEQAMQADPSEAPVAAILQGTTVHWAE